MALPLFCECLLHDLGFDALVGVHLLEPAVLVFKLLETLHQRCVHAAEFAAPFVKGGGAYAVFATQFWNGAAALGLLEDGDDLTVCKSG